MRIKKKSPKPSAKRPPLYFVGFSSPIVGLRSASCGIASFRFARIRALRASASAFGVWAIAGAARTTNEQNPRTAALS